MKILGIVDIHCSYQYCSRIAFEIARKEVDLVLIAGDIECQHPLEEILETGVRVYAVTGNMDDTYIYRLLKQYGIGVDGCVIEYSGYTIAGIGGIGFRTNLEKITKVLDKGVEQDKLIILSHYPAHGFNDKTYSGVHAGLYELRELIENYKPLLFLHGHIHEARGVSRYKNTLIVNPGPLMYGYYSLIKISSEGVEASLERL